MNTRNFALIFGLVFLVVGIGGFILTEAAPPPADLKVQHGFGHELGLFPVNTVHNIIHILFGIWGLAASRGLGSAITYARGVAIIYALLTVMGLIEVTRTSFGLAPIYGNDVWLHAAIAVVAGYFGFVHRNTGVTDRS
jgi:hypothetical protein